MCLYRVVFLFQHAVFLCIVLSVVSTFGNHPSSRWEAPSYFRKAPSQHWHPHSNAGPNDAVRWYPPPAHRSRDWSRKYYVPKPPVYVPKPPVYVSKPPVYVPKPPVYAPKPPVYVPKPPVYVPKPPVYVPKPPVYPVGGLSYPVDGASYNPYQSHSKDAYLNNILHSYMTALVSCTNEHNFACKIDPLSKSDKCELECYPLKYRCDGRRDCPLGEDEDECRPPDCRTDQVRCCKSQKCATPCNNVMECDWGEDERNCEAKLINCMTNQLKCPEGTCATVCNGVSECDNGEDENNCNFIEGCRKGEYVCPMAAGQSATQCATLCNNRDECAGREDETNCNNRFCPDNMIPCQTIEAGSVAEICADLCDHEVECADARDEDIDICFQCVYCSGDTECQREDTC